MCTVSMVADHYRDKYTGWPGILPTFQPTFQPTLPGAVPVAYVPREEFEALRRDVEDMKKLLMRAKAYDEANGEPDCEMEDKVDLLKRIAKAVGVDLSEVFGQS